MLDQGDMILKAQECMTTQRWVASGDEQDAPGTSGGPTSLLHQLQMMPLRVKKNVKGICIQNENFKTCAGQMKYMLPAPGLEGP